MLGFWAKTEPAMTNAKMPEQQILMRELYLDSPVIASGVFWTGKSRA
jgi:hypothetical protein